MWPAAVRRLAQGALEANHGDSGRVLAWALEAPAARARALVVRGAVLSVDGEVPPKLWGPLAPLRDEGGPLRAPMVARALVVELATGAVAELRHVARPMLDEADTIARTELSDTGQSRTSRLLPLAFEELAHDLAGRFEAGFPAPRALMTALRAHALAGTHARELELLADLDRLARYLHHAHGAPTGTALARAYLVDHAWADRCARRVENAIASSTRHERAARALLRKVRDARDAVNTTWTRGLQGAYGSTLFSADVVALQNVVRDEVVPRLHDRGVFLLVLDGCSVPVFLELLDQLCEPTNGIGLEVGPGLALRWRVGLSPLPTITSHARGALFLGAVPKDPFAAETLWREDGERKSDPARFKQNQALGDRPRSLFLKGDLADGGQALRDALRGPDAVVAAVFNAVDDRIGSHDTASAWRLHVDDVHGLVPALQAAFHAGRRVLATADHGHTPFRGTDGRVGAGNTPRYARLKDGDAVPDGFAEIDCGDLAGQPGRTAYAWRTGAYRGQVQVGFHGGCSLEEMVVPVAWLARDGVPADPPPWWIDGGGDEETRDAPPPRVEPSAAAGDPPPKGAPPPPGPAPGLPFAKPAAPVERIPALILAVLDEDQARAVAWILADGPLRTSVVAKRLGRPEGRVDGWLVKLARTLAGHGAKLVAEELPDGEKQWRYSGPEVAA